MAIIWLEISNLDSRRYRLRLIRVQMQKGNLVSIGRMIDVEGMAGGRAIDETDRHACHTYSPGNAEQAIRLGGTVRDFTDSADDLLAYK